MVVSIIALLVGILLPAIGMVRDSARSMVCRNNLRQLALAEMGYANDNEARLTPTNIDAFGPNAANTYWPSLLSAAGMADEKGVAYGDIRVGIFKCPMVRGTQMQFGGGYGLVRTWTMSNHAYQSGPTGESFRLGAPPALAMLMDTCFGPTAVAYVPGTTHMEAACGRCLNWNTAGHGVGAARHRNRINFVAMDGHVDGLTSSDMCADKSLWGH